MCLRKHQTCKSKSPLFFYGSPTSGSRGGSHMTGLCAHTFYLSPHCLAIYIQQQSEEHNIPGVGTKDYQHLCSCFIYFSSGHPSLGVCSFGSIPGEELRNNHLTLGGPHGGLVTLCGAQSYSGHDRGCKHYRLNLQYSSIFIASVNLAHCAD